MPGRTSRPSRGTASRASRSSCARSPRRGASGATTSSARPSGSTARCARPRARGRRREPLTSALLAEAAGGIAAHVRAGVRRIRARAEVPRGLDARVPAASGRRARAGDRHGDARRHGGGRLLRRGRRRLPPLLGRRPLARAALREDALRQRAPRVDIPPRLGRLPGARATARSSRRRSATCSASSRCPGAGSRRRTTPTPTVSKA